MNPDLSHHHHPLSDLFSLPDSQAEWDKYKLSEKQVQFYNEKGYLSGIRVFSDEQVEKLRAELEGLVQPNHATHHLWYEYNSNASENPSTVLFHALGAWRISKYFHDILWHPAITVAASQLIPGKDQVSVRLWHDQIFCKPAKHGGVVAWHQDYAYWTRTVPMMHITCFVALDDCTVENGCLFYVPESHKWPLLPITGLAGDMYAIKAVLNESQIQQFSKVPVELKKGEVTFHHPYLVHGSYENKSNGPRRAAVINLFADGVLSNTDKPMLSLSQPTIGNVPKGHKMDGQFYPLLYDPTRKAVV